MANYPPFMNSPGTLSKILVKIREAKAPERFTQDFLATKLGFRGGSAKAFIPVAKRMGLLGSDGTPTVLYHQFRNASKSKFAMAQAIRKGYAELFSRNEYANDLDRRKLAGLIMEVTGLDEGNKTLSAICGTFSTLKSLADFDGQTDLNRESNEKEEQIERKENDHENNEKSELGINLAYTINIVLPKSEDVAVFNAIFKSLKENLLRK